MVEAAADRHGGAMNENTSSLPPPPEPPRLSRRIDSKMIGGVAGGLARHFDVDVSLVRLGFVVLALFGGSGLLLYLIAWLVMPSDQTVAAPPSPRPETDDAPITVRPMV